MKKFVLVSLALIFGCVSFAQMPPVLASAYDASVQALAASPKIDEKAWQGFHFKEFPVLIYDPASRAALAVNVPTAPQGFSATAQPTIFYGAIPATDAIGSGIRPFGPKLMSWIDVKDISKSYVPSFVIIEEAFKIFEAYRGFNDRGVFVPGAYPVLNAENNAMARFENSILIKAVTSPKEEARSYLSAYSSAREKRQALLPKEIAESEDSRELVDGAASFAAYLSLNEDQQKGYVQEVLKRLDGYNRAGEGAEKRFKDTGFVQCYLFSLLQYDFRTTVEKYSKDSLKSPLKAVIANIAPADGSFFNMDAARAEENAAAKAEEDRRAAVLAKIQKADGLVIFIKLEDILAKSNGKLKWSEKVEPSAVSYFGKDKVFDKLYKLQGGDFFKFFAYRPVYFTNKTLTMGLSVDEFRQLYLMTIDGAPVAFAKDSPPLTGSFEARGPDFEIKILKATMTWSYPTRTLTIEPVYEPAV